MFSESTNGLQAFLHVSDHFRGFHSNLGYEAQAVRNLFLTFRIESFKI
jgi:hypothetical protein